MVCGFHIIGVVEGRVPAELAVEVQARRTELVERMSEVRHVVTW